MNSWLAAIIAMGGGLILGSIAGRITQQVLGRDSRPERLRSVAGPLGSLVFSVLLIAGLVTALGFINSEARDQIPRDLVDFLPSLLSGVIVVIGANVIAQLVEATLERTAASLPGAARNLPAVVRGVILAFGAILAAAQLGVDTTVINIVVAALMFSIGLAIALMVGLGSRTVASEVAAGRAIRRMINPGDVISVVDGTSSRESDHDAAETGRQSGLGGRVVRIGSVAVELELGESTLLVPHSQLLAGHLSIERGGAEPASPSD